MKNPIVQFILRCLAVGAVGALTYGATDVSSVADPETASLVGMVLTAFANFIHARVGAPSTDK